MQEFFNLLKEKLMTPRIPDYQDFEYPFLVKKEASRRAMGRNCAKKGWWKDPYNLVHQQDS